MAAGLEELTRQLNSFKPTSADIVGNLQENQSKEVFQKLLASDQKVDQLTDSLAEQRKTVADSAELLRDLMIGIENLGENMKNIQKEMDY
ncbi:MAG: hypothetical protein MI921_02620 [Cytophagales bacterium]|nr:hypothetical protein [Cytophagales bacterium]